MLEEYYPLILAIVAIVAIVVVAFVIRSPFKYPYFVKNIDISGRRSPQIDDLIDEYLIEHRMQEIDNHKQFIDQWKDDCQTKLQKSHLKKYRERQYKAALDDEHAYMFNIYRMQTRYKQANYQKTPYQVKNDTATYAYDYSYLENRNMALAGINYETSLGKNNSSNQRKLMTPALRRAIMERDNYTCQMCGKYMPDEVGLQIDHIIPIAKGGKTVPSNLQVLCSKCNGRKKDKIQ